MPAFQTCSLPAFAARKNLAIPRPFAISPANPLFIHPLAASHPDVPVIVPHFGAGFFREALMVADLCPNVLLDTSSSNAWTKYEDPELTLAAVFKRALTVVGPDRLLFGSDSSFFPRGWLTEVFERQRSALDEAGAGADVKEKVFGGNFDRLFPAQRSSS